MPISLPGEHLSLRIKAYCTPLAEVAASTLPVTVGGMSRRRAMQGNTDHPMALVSGGTTGLPQGSEPASASPARTGSSPRLHRPHLKNPEPPSPRAALCLRNPGTRGRGALPQRPGPLLPSAFQWEKLLQGLSPASSGRGRGAGAAPKGPADGGRAPHGAGGCPSAPARSGG